MILLAVNLKLIEIKHDPLSALIVFKNVKIAIKNKKVSKHGKAEVFVNGKFE